ncbi:MAG: hypothetical protein BBJ57_09025 [Desulfobacterales bacterium PC51MH44]|nr:MAG: hypothetical protein BBJ57_09025 [Desulfobacterales bacterium PC51MH44]
MTNKGKLECDHSPPCDNLADFKKIAIWVIGFQALFTLALLTACVSILVNQASASERITTNHAGTNEKILKISTRQEGIEKKADRATADASAALAIAGKAEANIAWIRENLTEVKISLREAIYPRLPNRSAPQSHMTTPAHTR